MSSHADATSRDDGPSPEADAPRLSWDDDDLMPQEDVDRLGDCIAELSAHIQAATYRLLVLIRRFDAAEGWHRAGFKTCAAWLSWRTGLGPGAAREKVRVARALDDLPELSEALECGELSYSAARAITRVATPGNEGELVEVARQATAAELERLVRAWRGAERAEAEARAGEAVRHADRRLSVVVDGEGGWRVSGRLDPEVGAVLRAALEAAEEALYRGGDGEDRDVPAPARRADALGLVAEAALGEGLGAGGTDEGADVDEEADEEAGTAEDDDEEDFTPAPVVGRAGRFEVVVHVDAGTLAGGNRGDVSAETPAGVGNVSAGTSGEGAGDADVSAETSDGAEDVSAETSRQAGLNGRPPDPPHVAGGPALAPEAARRRACDAGIVAMVHGRDGQVLDVGRRTRSVPPAMRRALDHRDRGCRFPGCACRFCDAHHVVPWAEGGETRLDNLVLLCRRHHRRVHEEGWHLELVDGETTADGRPAVRVRRPEGTELPAVPGRPAVPGEPVAELKRRQKGLGIDEWTATADGVAPALDVDFALYALMPPLEENRAERDGLEEESGGADGGGKDESLRDEDERGDEDDGGGDDPGGQRPGVDGPEDRGGRGEIEDGGGPDRSAGPDGAHGRRRQHGGGEDVSAET